MAGEVCLGRLEVREGPTPHGGREVLAIWLRAGAPLLAERANATPPVPENPVSLPGDLWLCGPHRVLCGDATSPEAVARLLSDRQPILLVTDPPYGIELDSEWRDRAGLNGGDFGS